MLCSIPSTGLRISDPSLPQRFIGFLRHPAAQPYPRFDSAHLRFRCALRTVLRHRGPFQTMEEVLLPCSPPLRRLYI